MVYSWQAPSLHSVIQIKTIRNCLLCIDQYPALSILRAWICNALFLWDYSSWSVFCSFEEHSAQKMKQEYSDNFTSLKKQYHHCTDHFF